MSDHIIQKKDDIITKHYGLDYQYTPDISQSIDSKNKSVDEYQEVKPKQIDNKPEESWVSKVIKFFIS